MSECPVLLQEFFVCLRFYSPVNSYGHVELVSYPLTLFVGRLIATKRLTSTWRAGEHASGSN